MTRRSIVAVICLLGLVTPSQARAALVFNFTTGPELTALQGSNPALYNNVVIGFAAAGQRFSNLFSDNVTVQVTINFKTLGAGILGSADSNTIGVTYAGTRTALIADQTTADDATATASLPNVAALSFLTNDRAGAVILDNDGSANNSVLDVNRANARALGLIGNGDTAEDSSITFSSLFTWDFDPNNGISAGAFDFVGVATHEIGHAMGFVSGVDTVDFFSGPNGPGRNDDLNGGAAGIGTLDPFRVFSVLDLYRYGAPGVRNLAYGGAPYMSLNGGVTSLGAFSTGAFNGDGNQASHWKDNLSLGIMDPTAAPGELLAFSTQDIRAFDVIGWNFAPSSSAVPEPASLTLVGLGFLAMAGYRIRHRKADSQR